MSTWDAEILAVGSELLTPTKIDTNSLWLTEQLNALGVEVVGKAIAGDDRMRLTGAVIGAMTRARLVVITGGLGPTEDDLTRDAVAGALGRGLTFNEEIRDTIAARFARMGRVMVENNTRQAFVIDGAEVLPNDRGTAPGQWIDADGHIVILLPGPPREMKAMWELQCLPRLQAILPPAVIRTRFYRVSCMPESDLDQLIAPVYTKYTNPATTILAGPGDIQIHLRARCATAEEADALLNEVCPPIEELIGDRLYTRAGDPLEVVAGQVLQAAGATLAVAESATGGLLGERITSVPGSSAWFKGGFLVYTNEMKTALLGISPEMLREHTEVSAPVAESMASAARERTGATYALSVTGYAGPDGGDDANPVGTMFIGVASPSRVTSRRLPFLGDRTRVRTMTTVWALDLLRRELLKS